MTLDTKDIPQAITGVEEQENAEEQQTWQDYALHTTKKCYGTLQAELLF